MVQAQKAVIFVCMYVCMYVHMIALSAYICGATLARLPAGVHSSPTGNEAWRAIGEPAPAISYSEVLTREPS
jgi:hypothetical protein